MSGKNKPTGIAQWVRLRRKQLAAAFNLQREGLSSPNTLRRTSADTVSAEELASLWQPFLQQAYGGQQSFLVVLDGKTLPGTMPVGRRQGIHLLAAFLPQEGIVLMQVAVSQKENVITARAAQQRNSLWYYQLIQRTSFCRTVIDLDPQLLGQ